MTKSILTPLLTILILLTGCTTNTPLYGGTYYFYIRPSAKDFDRSRLTVEEVIEQAIGIEYEKSELIQDFNTCKSRYGPKRAEWDNPDPRDNKLIACMESLGWKLSSAIV